MSIWKLFAGDEEVMSVEEQVEVYGKSREQVLGSEAEVQAAWLWDWEAFEEEGSSEHQRVARIAQKADQRMERRREAAGGSVW